MAKTFSAAQIAQSKHGRHHIAMAPNCPKLAFVVVRVRGDRVQVCLANDNSTTTWLNQTASRILLENGYRE